MSDAAAEVAPQVGPQVAFAECPADIAIFGGAAQGGKSWALLYEAAKWIHLRDYRAILFRRETPQLTGLGGLIDKSMEIYPLLGGRYRAGAHLDWTFPSGARIVFRHMQRVQDRMGHQGLEYAFVGFDELTHFAASQFWYLTSRNRTTCGVDAYIRGTCNPDPDSFVATLVEWWIGPDGYAIPERSGVLRWIVRIDEELHWFPSKAAAQARWPGKVPKSFTFIASRLEDNPLGDPNYQATLELLPRVDRLRLLGEGGRGGNWRIREAAGLVFKRDEFKMATAPPSPIVRTVRAWDVASLPPSTERPDPDWTRGVRVSLCRDGELWIDDMRSTRSRSAITLKLIRRTAAGHEGPELEAILKRRARVREEDEGDGPGVWVGLWQDPGGAGVIALDTIRDRLAGYAVDAHTTSKDKLAFAKVWAPLVEHGRVYILRGAPWAGTLIGECDAFPDGNHDDIVDAISLAVQVLLGSGLGFWDSFKEGARRLTEG